MRNILNMLPCACIKWRSDQRDESYDLTILNVVLEQGLDLIQIIANLVKLSETSTRLLPSYLFNRLHAAVRHLIDDLALLAHDETWSYSA